MKDILFSFKVQGNSNSSLIQGTYKIHWMKYSDFRTDLNVTYLHLLNFHHEPCFHLFVLLYKAICTEVSLRKCQADVKSSECKKINDCKIIQCSPCTHRRVQPSTVSNRIGCNFIILWQQPAPSNKYFYCVS